MNKAEQQEIEDLYETIVDLFDRKCGICGESYDKVPSRGKRKGKRKAFVLHHREYPAGWKKWTDFPLYDKAGNIVKNKRGILHNKLEYLRYLIPLIQTLSKEQANKIFGFMHNNHHHTAQMFARHKQPTLGKMIELVQEIDRQRAKR